MEEEVSFRPVNVRLLRADTVVLQPDPLAQLVEKLRATRWGAGRHVTHGLEEN